MTARPGVDVRAWLIWVGATAVLVMIAGNPLYTLILLLVARLALAAWSDGDRLELPFWRLGALMIGFSTLFNALSVHLGQTVLFRLPEGWPLVGGAVTLEAAVFGAANGLLLLTLLAVFVVLNAVAPAHELARLTPPALQDLGLVVLIAISYVPETLRQLRRIREAQAIRGHRLRGLRDWRPVAIPLLVGGLERSMALAEAMVARGFGATRDEGQSGWTRLGLAAGLAAALVGWTLSFWFGWVGWTLLAAGTAVLLVLLWRQGRTARRTRYRPQRWTWRETALTVTGVLVVLVVLLPDWSSLGYSPYPRLHLPPFEAAVGLALAALALPAVLTADR